MQASLFKLDDGSTDNEGRTNAILIYSSLNEVDLRSEQDCHDHGGMPFEDFARVWATGELTRITKLEDIPKEWLSCLPYSTTELDDVDLFPEEFLDEMDENAIIDVWARDG